MTKEKTATDLQSAKEIEMVFNQACSELGYSFAKAEKDNTLEPVHIKGSPLVFKNTASRIEHTLLGIAAEQKAIENICKEVASFKFRSVCVLPRDVETCRNILFNTGYLVVTDRKSVV